MAGLADGWRGVAEDGEGWWKAAGDFQSVDGGGKCVSTEADRLPGI